MGTFGVAVRLSIALKLGDVDERGVELTRLCLGGITNGLDMIAAFIREMWPGPTAEAALAIADVGERGEEYGSSKASENAWWVWQILRAWVNGPKR